MEFFKQKTEKITVILVFILIFGNIIKRKLDLR